MVFEEVAGRTTAIVPSVQLLRSPFVSVSSTAARTKVKTVKKEDSVTTETISFAASMTAPGATVKIKRKMVKVEVNDESVQEINNKRPAKVPKVEVIETSGTRKSPRLN